ncbi:hypothetical protein [Halomonas stenophila]|uniref:Uncharacterized protein n=1 Tax=Halomonas stenophila TaxID=795312 RepID=A0A7W5HJP2_9GAMM|nr:hypothetical protein [Halomonas stenophila]MBB3231070.1 hypothetical protein [Halomonas stenophila]
MSTAIKPGWFNASLLAEIHGKDAAKFMKLPEVRAFLALGSGYTDTGFEDIADRRGGDIILRTGIMYVPFVNYLEYGDARELLEWLADGLEEACSDASMENDTGIFSATSIIEEYRKLVAELKRKGSTSSSL